MKTTLSTLQKWLTAITFAEAGEWESARQMSPLVALNRKVNRFDRVFMAASFAEAGLHAEACVMAQTGSCKAGEADDFFASLGLAGIRMTYGVLAVESAR